MISFHCPKCHQKLKAPDERAGHSTRCPQCREQLTIPEKAVEVRERVVVKEKFEEEVNDGPLSRPSTKINQEELIDMTAMVDIVFFLLIFFLVTSMSTIQSSAPLPRPEAQNEEGGASSQHQEKPPNDSNSIVVKIGKDDSIEIDGVPFRDVADVAIRFRQLRQVEGTDASMLIIGHGDATHGAAAAILDAGYEAGINRLRLAVVDDGSSGQ